MLKNKIMSDIGNASSFMKNTGVSSSDSKNEIQSISNAFNNTYYASTSLQQLPTENGPNSEVQRKVCRHLLCLPRE